MTGLTSSQLAFFHEKGYLLLEELFTAKEVDLLSDRAQNMGQLDREEIFREEESQKVRTIFSPDLFDTSFEGLHQSGPLFGPVQAILGEAFYLFQSKLNNKASLASGSWPWHQDFTFWKDDGMPASKAITAAVFLTDVTEVSGPMILVPGSHRLGTIEASLENPDGVHDENLKYRISAQTLEEVMKSCGEARLATGPKGSVLFFHSNVLHSSTQNMHFEDRLLMMYTYNPVSNQTDPVPNPRPEYMVRKDFAPLSVLSAQ